MPATSGPSIRASPSLPIPGLDRGTLEPVLTYCAEERCIADDASCPGCRRRTQAEGITSFDQFVARHKEIVIGDGAVRLTGQGEGTLHVESLEALARPGRGRSTGIGRGASLRKLRHGIRRAHIQGRGLRRRGRDARRSC